jgi:hypothetical protein
VIVSVRSMATCRHAPTCAGVVTRRASLIRASRTSISGVLARNALRTVSGDGALRRSAAVAETRVRRAQAAKRTDRSARAGPVRL